MQPKLTLLVIRTNNWLLICCSIVKLMETLMMKNSHLDKEDKEEMAVRVDKAVKAVKVVKIMMMMTITSSTELRNDLKIRQSYQYS
jgi:hypothetical protein